MKLKNIFAVIMGLLMVSTVVAAPLVIKQNQKSVTAFKTESQKEVVSESEEMILESKEIEKMNNIKLMIENVNEKTIKIDAASGTITSNKSLILEEIKNLINMDLENTEMSIEDSSRKISLNGTHFTILLNNVNTQISHRIEGFTVKRNQTTQEINSDIRLATFFLSDDWLSSNKELQIDTTSKTIEENKEKILKTLKSKEWYIKYKKDFFDKVTIQVKENQNTLLSLKSTPVIFMISKKGGTTREVNVFKVSQNPIKKNHTFFNIFSRLVFLSNFNYSLNYQI